MDVYRVKKFALLFLMHTIGMTSVFAGSDFSNTGSPQAHFEVQVHNRSISEFNFLNTLFLAPLKYQVKNEHRYKIPNESTQKMFTVQLYKAENHTAEASLSSANFINFNNTPIKPKGLVTINILNGFKITLLPFFDWKAFQYNDFYYSQNHLTKTNSITLFQIEDQ